MQKAKHGYGTGKLNPNFFVLAFSWTMGRKTTKKNTRTKIDVKPDSKPESLITK